MADIINTIRLTMILINDIIDTNGMYIREVNLECPEINILKKL